MSKRMYVVMLFALILLVFTGCSDNSEVSNDDENSVISNSTLDYSDVNWQELSTEGYEDNRFFQDGMARGTIGESNRGIYWLNWDTHKIEYFESSVGPRTVLCGKPNCYHYDDSCNAYVSGVELLGMYNERLYYKDFSKIGSLKLDGTDHRTELFLPTELLKYSDGFTAGLDNGYLYCADISFEEDKTAFLRISLEDESVEYVVSEDFYITGYLDCHPYKDKLYIDTVETIDGERVDTDYVYSFDDKELVNLSEKVVGNLIAVTDSTLYTSTGQNVWTHDIATGKNELLFEVDSTLMCNKCFDGKYFYIEEWSTTAVDEPRNLFVYDTDGNLICKGAVDFEGSSKTLPNLYAITKDAVIFTLGGESLSYAVLKSDIEKGELNFIDISNN